MKCNVAQQTEGRCNRPTIQRPKGRFFLFLKKEKRYFCRVVASKSGIVTETSEGARTKFP